MRRQVVRYFTNAVNVETLIDLIQGHADDNEMRVVTISHSHRDTTYLTFYDAIVVFEPWPPCFNRP